MIELNDINSGANFLRADLHIHSIGDEGSFDVFDTMMTPENIVDTAIEKGLSIISITDHNEIGNVKRGIKHSENKNILVIPGSMLPNGGVTILWFFTINMFSPGPSATLPW